MKKRKFKKGPQVVSVAEIPEHDWFIVKAGTWDRTMHREMLRSWTIRTCEQFIDHGMIFIAQRLTNGEFYEGMNRSVGCSKTGCAITARCRTN